jgi:hypothetical protein
LVAKASSLLMKEGLNFNQKKVKVMTFDGFSNYYAFEHFFSLVSDTNKSKVENEIDFYLSNKSELRKEGISLLKILLRTITRNKLKPNNLNDLKLSMLNRDFLLMSLPNSSDWILIYDLLTSREKKIMVDIFEEIIQNYCYSLFLYNVRQLYKAINHPYKHITNRLNRLKRFYSLA